MHTARWILSIRTIFVIRIVCASAAWRIGSNPRLWGGAGPGVVMYSCNDGANEVFTLSQGALCSHPETGKSTHLCLVTKNTKPGKGGGGGGGHHPKPPVHPASAVLEWVGPLAGGSHVALLVNNQATATTLRFNASVLGATGEQDLQIGITKLDLVMLTHPRRDLVTPICLWALLVPPPPHCWPHSRIGSVASPI